MKNIEEMIAVMTAYNEGKTIQCSNADMDWEDWPNPSWDWSNFDYRVKPTVKLRPYANAMEFLYAMKEHGPYITRGGEPYAMATIVGECAYDVWIEGDSAVSYSEIFKLYKWQDGTPCGVEEEGGEE